VFHKPMFVLDSKELISDVSNFFLVLCLRIKNTEICIDPHRT
jgi:hypothetical protein